jgi:ferredoxin
VAEWLEQLRTFHLTGRGLPDEHPQPLRPAVVDALEKEGRLGCDFPVYLSTEPSVRPLAAVIEECIRKEPDSFPVLSTRVSAAAKSFGDHATDPAGTPVAAVADRVLAELAGAVPEGEIARLGLLLPKQGTLFPCHAAVAPVLFGHIAGASRSWARAQWLARLTASRNLLRDLLAADETHGVDAHSAEQLQSTLGVEGQFFDPSAMARALGHKKGPRRMAEQRRKRIEDAAATLDAALRAEGSAPAAWVLHSGKAPAGAPALRWECSQAEDSFAAAAALSRKMLERAEPVWRAVRLARLEAESAYDEAVHGERMARFTWHAASPEELLGLPLVIAIETAARAADSLLASFGRLLRSGMPVHVLITAAGIDPQLPDLGYLAMAHRGAFVLSTALARVEHFASELAAMSVAVRPAVAVVAVPGEGEGFREASSAAAARVHALYRCDPEKGETWMERFELHEADVAALSVQTGQGSETLTPAHAAAMSATLRGHFRLLPADQQDADLLEMNEYLARYDHQPPLAIPYLPVIGESGQPARAAVTRELAMFCHERIGAWRALAELAGVGNAHVERAVAAAREKEQAEAAAREEKAREAAARDAATATVHRLVLSLLGGQPLSAPRAVVPAASVSPAPAEAPASPDQPVSKAAVSAAPYIESELCTSCGDCININQRLFRYNADKQAYIADPAAGSYADLVKAAEKCPARCIHPGAPRPGDASATPALVARGAKFG